MTGITSAASASPAPPERTAGAPGAPAGAGFAPMLALARLADFPLPASSPRPPFTRTVDLSRREPAHDASRSPRDDLSAAGPAPAADLPRPDPGPRSERTPTRDATSPRQTPDGARADGAPFAAGARAHDAGASPDSAARSSNSPDADPHSLSNPSSPSQREGPPSGQPALVASYLSRAPSPLAPATATGARPATGSPTGSIAVGRAGPLSPALGRAGSPSPAHAPSRSLDAEHARLAAQVMRGLGALLRQAGGSVTLRLDPPALGALRLDLDVRDGVVRASLEASTLRARELLDANLGSLRSALEARGLIVSRLDVSLGRDAAPAPDQTQRDEPTPDGGASGRGEERRHGRDLPGHGSPAPPSAGNDPADAEDPILAHQPRDRGGIWWAEPGIVLRVDALA
jgi:flagellar hook-length control protein FliK